MICCARYVWAHRTALARSVHDMAKQMYDNKLYSPKAWKPLSDWLFDCSEDEADRRSGVLTKFSNLDTEFFAVVARCLWAWGGNSLNNGDSTSFEKWTSEGGLTGSDVRIIVN